MRYKMLVEDKIPILADIVLQQLFKEHQYLKTIDIDSMVKVVDGKVIRYYDIFYRGNLYFTVDWFGDICFYKHSFNMFEFSKVLKSLETRGDIWEEYLGCKDEIL